MSGYRIKDIAGYEGRYAVTDDGRVWSYVSNKWLSTPLNDWGYPRLGLNDKNGVRKDHSVHRLVAAAFCCQPENSPEVNHIDGNKKNNNATNLEWVTTSENAKHAWDSGLRANNKGYLKAQKARRAFCDQSVIAIRQMFDFGWSIAAISRAYQASTGSIRKIVLRQSYREVL